MTGGIGINAAMLYSEINILCVVIMLIIAVKITVSGFDKSNKNRIFSYSVYLATAANICDFLWNLCFTGTVYLPAEARYLIDFLYFMTFGASALCWLIYTDIVQKNGVVKNKKLFAVYLIPLVVLAALLIVNRFNGCLFYIDKSGEYFRGSLFYAQQVLAYCYIVISAVKCFSKATLRNNFAQHGYFLTLSTFVIPPIICGIIQTVVQDIPVLSVGIVISYLLAYINSLERLILLDPLTGISNRRDFLQRLEDGVKSLKPNEDLYFIFIDIDYFKSINDTLGHNEGDRVLKEIAAALKKYANNIDGACGRYGGDEFALFIITELTADIGSRCTELEEYIKQRHITCSDGKEVAVSIGCSKYLGASDDIQRLIYRADERMYGLKNDKRKGKIKA